MHDHLVSLPGGGGSGGTKHKPRPGPSLRHFVPHLPPSGGSIGFSMTCSQAATGTLTAKTVNRFAVATRKRAQVSLGTVHFKLKANKRVTIVLTLGRAGRALLRSHRSLATQVTITLVNAAKRRSVIHRTVTLRRAAHR